MMHRLVAVAALLAACSSAKPYQRAGSRDAVQREKRTAVCMTGFPGLSVDIYYKGRKTGAWFMGVTNIGSGIGRNIDKGKNQEMHARLRNIELGEYTRDTVAGAIEPIVKRLDKVTIRESLRLPNPAVESPEAIFKKHTDIDRCGVDPGIWFYGVPDDSAILKLQLTLYYLERTDGGGLQRIWQDAFVYESNPVTHEALEADPQIAKSMIRDAVKTLQPWLRAELTGGKNRHDGKPRQTVHMDSGAELTGVVLTRKGSHVVVRGEQGLVHAIPAQYVKQIEDSSP